MMMTRVTAMTLTALVDMTTITMTTKTMAMLPTENIGVDNNSKDA